MKIKLIDYGAREENFLPARAHYNDAGADVYATQSVSIAPGQVVKMPLGFGVELPDGYVGFVFPRSSLSAKGINCLLPPIDSGYRGEIHAILTNDGDITRHITGGDRIGQLVILPCVLPDFAFDLGAERKAAAFGSSGK